MNDFKINYERVNPDSIIQYGIKRLIEKGQGYLTLKIFKSKRPGYLMDILDRRMNELAYSVIEEKRNSFEESSSRYTTYTGIISDELINFDGKNKDYLINELEKHMKIIEYLKTKYNYDTAEWRFLQQDYESAEVLLSKLN